MQHDGDNRVFEFASESWLLKVDPKVHSSPEPREPLPISPGRLWMVSRHGGKPSQCRRLREGEMTLVKQRANRLEWLRFEALECKADADRGGLVDYNGNRRWRWRWRRRHRCPV